jgi:hypothetical protein
MRQRPRNKIHPHRPRRLRAELEQLQTFCPQLQGKLGVTVLRQLQTLGPRSSSERKSRLQRFDADADADCGLRPILI